MTRPDRLTGCLVVLALVVVELTLVLLVAGATLPPIARCGSDADCARWEREHLPPEAWCYPTLDAGGYCLD